MTDLTPYLCASAVVDYGHPAIRALARTLAAAAPGTCAKQCFDWVRDNIEHSIDFKRNELSCNASEALAAGTGLCISKSHLLVALLRANGIPAGFCYQRLTLQGSQAPYCTHCYVAVWLDGHGWYRCDARGNSKPGMHCAFTPGDENLAYPVQYEGECMYPGVWAEPWPELIGAMRALGDVAHYCMAPIDAAPPSAGAVS